MSTKAEELAEYLGVTPKNAKGLYRLRGMKHYLTPHHPGHPDLTRDEQAAWLLAMVESEDFVGMDAVDDTSTRLAYWWSKSSDDRVQNYGKTPDLACLNALLAADPEFAKRWKECDQ